MVPPRYDRDRDRSKDERKPPPVIQTPDDLSGLRWAVDHNDDLRELVALKNELRESVEDRRWRKQTIRKLKNAAKFIAAAIAVVSATIAAVKQGKWPW